MGEHTREPQYLHSITNGKREEEEDQCRMNVSRSMRPKNLLKDIKHSEQLSCHNKCMLNGTNTLKKAKRRQHANSSELVDTSENLLQG